MFGPSSSKKVDQTATPAHGNRRKLGINPTHSDYDSEDDDDDVFSPEKSPAAQDPAALFSRLSVSGTSGKASGKKPMSSELRPKRSVTFKTEAEMILTTTSPGPSSTSKLSERPCSPQCK